MKLARWLLPIVSLLAVVWFTWLDVRAGGTGPGPLHSAHAAVAALDGGARCEACHAPGAGIDAARCTACHTAIGAQLATRSGLHGSLPAPEAPRCERCHGEHHGDDAPLIAPYAFARAGVPDPVQYDHAHVAFGLRGAHAQLACARCHRHADAERPPAGGRFLGLSQQCTSCHHDAHAGAFGAGCADCHGQEQPWQQAPHFAHERFALHGAHARVACAECHAPGSDRDVAVARHEAKSVRTCRDCHADPHGEHGRAMRVAEASDCARCHAPTAWHDARPDASRHAALGFPLLGAHAAVACVACHGAARAPARWAPHTTGSAPAADDCRACHSSPHREGLLAAGRCADCHAATDASFAAGRITAATHAATGFALAEPHARVDCRRCHTGAAWHERFPGRAASDCRACHADVHGGQFDAKPRQCTACHATGHFVPHRFGRDAHAASAFPLTGAHEAVACTRCHATVQHGVRTFVGTPRSCAVCHRDPHAGAFDRPGRPATVAGRDGCARCHDTVSFAAASESFEHAAWTGHELRGAHARLACAACHAPTATRRLGPVAGKTCAACHADPHAGQFRGEAASTDCARCHEEVSFTPARFDHQRDSRFRLDAVHARLACSACHVGVRLGERTVVRYRPLGTACGDCHRLGKEHGR